MDLWNLFARLAARKALLAGVLLLSLGLGVLGWVSTAPAYSLTASQALRTSQQTPEGTVTSTGSFELGMIGVMLVQNTMSQPGYFGNAVVTSTNSVVTPPAAIPLITTSVTADSPEAATEALKKARALNARFLRDLLASERSESTVSLVNMPFDSTPTMSNRPRIRSAGVGAILGGLGGLTALLVWDSLQRRRRDPRGWTQTDQPTRP